jgi:hypothetical protein
MPYNHDTFMLLARTCGSDIALRYHDIAQESDQACQRAESRSHTPVAPARPQGLDLSGQWYREGDFLPHAVVQQGDVITIQAYAPNGALVLHAQGRLSGRKLRLAVTYVTVAQLPWGMPSVAQAEAVCTVSADSRCLQGPFVLRR